MTPEPEYRLLVDGEIVAATDDVHMASCSAWRIAGRQAGFAFNETTGNPVRRRIWADIEYLMVAPLGDAHDLHVPYMCRDRADVERHLGELLYSGGPVDDEQRESVRAQCNDLIEEGFIHFEGDPCIHLYRLKPE